ncbi:hypothetical protein Tco_0824100 [Tanacetum coccineum]|uniref:Uncharacterized protein n=1 Tax=Tanacetum coccineum TaxID=301880 RepID=A0ABQ5AJS9_9ASTR
MEESDILWKLTLLFPDLRVMVPISNLIVALAVVRNGVPKMKGLFSIFFDIQNHKVYGEYMCFDRLIFGPVLSSIHCLGLPYWHFYFGSHLSVVRGSAGCEFLEKAEHFSHSTVDFLALLEDGVLKSFHSFGVQSHVIPYSSLQK